MRPECAIFYTRDFITCMIFRGRPSGLSFRLFAINHDTVVSAEQNPRQSPERFAHVNSYRISYTYITRNATLRDAKISKSENFLIDPMKRTKVIYGFNV